jgi:DNA-binding Xre family transcriptional regulator
MARMQDAGTPCTYKIISDGTGITRGNLSRLATNKIRMVRLETLEKLCGFFDCELQDLMILDGDSRELPRALQ